MRDERVEHRIGEKRQRFLKSPPMGPTRPTRGCDLTHLRGLQRETQRMERAAERELHRGVAVPAELDHLGVGSEQREAGLQARGGRAGVHDEIAPVIMCHRPETEV